MKKESIWLQNVAKKNFPSLKKDIETDVLIIGGGLTGIATAFELMNGPMKVTLIDKGEIGRGITAHSTGKLTYLQDLVYQKISKTYDDASAYLYYCAQKDAIKKVKETVLTHQIKCDFEDCDSYLFTNDKKEIAKIAKEQEFFTEHHIDSVPIQELPISFPSLYGIKVTDTAVFHPIKYLHSLVDIMQKKNIAFYENTNAISLEDHTVTTSGGKIKAKWIVIATHYPFTILQGRIPLKTHIENSYILASKTTENKRFSAITSANPTYSMRYLGEQSPYFLFCTNSHKTSNQIDYEKQYDELQTKYHTYFNDRIDYIWHAHDLMTNDYLPYVGKVAPNILIATGYNKWGMTNSIVAGSIMADIIVGRKNRYQDLYSFERTFSVEKAKNFIVDAFSTSKIYLQTKLFKNYDFFPTNVQIKTEKGVRIGIYKDENGIVHKVKNKCPHMGCNLTFNNFDKTWDCPCHGSRYTIDGDVLTGPTTKSIRL